MGRVREELKMSGIIVCMKNNRLFFELLLLMSLIAWRSWSLSFLYPVFIKIFLIVILTITPVAMYFLQKNLPDDNQKKKWIILLLITTLASFSTYTISDINSREAKRQLRTTIDQLRDKLEEEISKNRKLELLSLSLGQDYDSFLTGLAKSKNMGCAIPPSNDLNDEHFIKGYALYKVGGFSDEGESYKWAIEEFMLAKKEADLENSSELWQNIGFCYNQMGNKEEAIQALKKSLSFGECAQNYSTLAKIYMDNGQYKEAGELLNKAIKNKNLEQDEMIIYCRDCVSKGKTFSQKSYVKDKTEE